MGIRFNPAPGWPPPPPGFMPGPGWHPDPSWPPAPPGWPLLVNDPDAPDPTPPRGRGAPAPPRPPGRRAPARPPLASGAPGPRTGRPTTPGTPGPGTVRPVPSAPGPGTGRPTTPGIPRPGTPGPGDVRPLHDAPRTDALALASLVLSLLGGTLLSLALGVLALRRIRRTGERGRELAIAGICIASMTSVALLVVGASLLAQRPADGSPERARPAPTAPVEVTRLRAGDCFVLPKDASRVRTVRLTPCTQPHNAQVYKVFTLDGDTYPGDKAIRAQERRRCEQSAASLLTKGTLTDSTTLMWFQPLADGWAQGSRAVQCVVHARGKDLRRSVVR